MSALPGAPDVKQRNPAQDGAGVSRLPATEGSMASCRSGKPCTAGGAPSSVAAARCQELRQAGKKGAIGALLHVAVSAQNSPSPLAITMAISTGATQRSRKPTAFTTQALSS